ncbi:MAG: pyridoxine 5'-phosphate synthase [Phycisphaeraceae bacterium]|nr:pyridoxine 5'-phosphate synthase [Phycisphaeraceae bacterium]
MPLLGVNVDHVATIRQARYRSGPGGSAGYGEPDVVPAAAAAVRGGAECITLHLREDRRHVIDRDVEQTRDACHVKFNLEMAGTVEMQSIALRHRVDQVTLVPEGRQEVTTEGGLAVAGKVDHWKAFLAPLKESGIVTSAFITPDPEQAEAAAAAGFDALELHTGAFAHAWIDRDGAGGETYRKARESLVRCVRDFSDALRIHAGHALNYQNTPDLLSLPGARSDIRELHIGHSIVSRAVFVGLEQAVREMKRLVG